MAPSKQKFKEPQHAAALGSALNLADTDTSTPAQNRSLRPRNRDGSASTASLKRRRGQQNLQAAVEKELQEQFEGDIEDDEGHSEKKRRSSIWPLDIEKTPSSTRGHNNGSRGRSSRKSTTPKRSRGASKLARASKFLEGSMNDKPSNPPPNEFTSHESAMENYMEGDDMEMDTCPSEDNEAPVIQHKPSGMLRFGKAIANVLNPKSVWQGMSGMWRDNQEESTGQNDELEERKIKAEKVYQEFSKSGFFAANAVTHSQTHVERAIKQEPTDDGAFPPPPSRDSGICVSDYRSSNETRRDDLTTDTSTLSTSRTSLTTPSGSTPWTSTQSLAETIVEDTPRASHRRINSMQSLKKVASRFTLKGSKTGSVDLTSPASVEDPEHSPVKMLSRKDLQKQEKLNKKISNLEAQLEKARKERALIIDLDGEGAETIPPIPPLPAKTPKSATRSSSFSPSKLPTILSERMVAPTNGVNPTSSFSTRMSRARSVAPSSTAVMIEDALRRSDRKRRPSMRARASTDVLEDRKTPEKNKPITKKRKSDEALDAEEKEHTTGEMLKEPRKRGRPRKSLKVNREDSPASSVEDAAEVHSLIDYTCTKTPSKPKFDVSMIDQDKIMSLRKNPSNKPFLSTNEDIENLQKEYPQFSAAELAEWMGRQDLAPVGFKTTPPKKENVKPSDRDSVIFQNGKPTTILPPPNNSFIPAPNAVKSTQRTLRRKDSRHFSPPRSTSTSKAPTPSPRRSLGPSSNTRAKRPGTGSVGTAITVTPSNGKHGIPPVPKVPDTLEGKRVKVDKNGAVKTNEKGDWKGWDDDVF